MSHETHATQRKHGKIAQAACMAGCLVLSGALVVSTIPTTAFAEASTDAPASAPTVPSDGAGQGGPGGGTGQGGPGAGGAGGADTSTYDYTGSLSAAFIAQGESVSESGTTYEATESGQNAVLVQDGATLTADNLTLVKSGDDTDGDACNFYGVNSILLAVGEGSTAYLDQSSLSASSEGSNGIFATDGATVYAHDITIATEAGNSRGLDATYGGTIVASDADIQTQGDHSAGVATDRGGGNISLTDAEIQTAGSGSPILYSTGDIEVNNITGTSSGSQIAGMEGTNTILINNSDLTSTITNKTASDPVANGVIIYQSTSGDAEASTGDAATFQAANSSLTSSIASGSMFYLTNTTANMVLANTDINFDSTSANLITAAGNDANSWGTAGQNGATVNVSLIGEDVSGNIEADTISQVVAYLTDNTTWTGATVISQNDAGQTVDNPISMNVDGTSTWVVTEDCTLSNLTLAEGAQVVDAAGDTVTIVAGGSVVQEGTSDITVTVENSYSTDYDASAAPTLSDDLIDRTAFDETYGTETSFTMNEAQDTASDQAESTTTTQAGEQSSAQDTATDSGSTNPVLAFFQQIGAWFSSIFW
ncbi:MAG: hypothetical protein ACOX4F_04920 [Atopobiaceae bacterium]|jgi:hypothetical protein